VPRKLTAFTMVTVAQPDFRSTR